MEIRRDLYEYEWIDSPRFINEIAEMNRRDIAETNRRDAHLLRVIPRAAHETK